MTKGEAGKTNIESDRDRKKEGKELPREKDAERCFFDVRIT